MLRHSTPLTTRPGRKSFCKCCRAVLRGHALSEETRNHSVWYRAAPHRMVPNNMALVASEVIASAQSDQSIRGLREDGLSRRRDKGVFEGI